MLTSLLTCEQRGPAGAMPAAGNGAVEASMQDAATGRAAAKQLLSACAARERALKELLAERTFYEQPVRAARQQLGAAYEALLLQDYDAAQARPPAEFGNSWQCAYRTPAASRCMCSWNHLSIYAERAAQDTDEDHRGPSGWTGGVESNGCAAVLTGPESAPRRQPRRSRCYGRLCSTA